MTSNTQEAEVSSTGPAQTEAEEKAAREARAELLRKAVTRMDEVSERVALIARASKGAVPELIKHHPLGEVMDLFTLFEDAVTKLSSEVVELGKIISYAREVTLPERLDEEELKTFTAANGDRMSRTARIFANIKPGMQDKAFEWLRANDYEALIKETVNASSLSAAAKEIAESGFELPEDIFGTHTKDGVSITRKKKG